MSQLQAMGVGGHILIIFAAFFLCVEIIKGLKVIWEFVAPKIFNIQTNISIRKETDELTRKNALELSNLIRNQKESENETLNVIKLVSKDVTSLKEDVDKRFSSIDDNMSTLSDTVQDMQLENMRNTILNFGAGVGNDKIYSKEQYEYVKKIYKVYHEIIKSTGKTNDEIEINYTAIILPSYEEHIKNRDFLEYVLEDKKVNAAIGEKIDMATKPKRTTRKRTTKKKTEETDKKEE